MSSKLVRGGELSIEPMAWRQVSAGDLLPPDPSGAFAPYQTAAATAPALESGMREMEPRLRSVYQQGFQDGQAAARQEAAGQVDALAVRVARSIEEMSGLRERFRHEAEEDVVALSLAIARRVLHRELTVAPEALLGLVKAALEMMEVREVHRVRVHPNDAALVQQHLEQMGLPRRVEVLADPSLERGAVILESSRGALDASVETQLAEIERGFTDLVRRTP